MTLYKTIGFSLALAAAFALTATMAFANEGEKRPVPFLKNATVVIGGAGNVLVRGAEVTAVSNDTITAKTAWDDATLTWTVDTDSDTDFVSKDNDSEDIGDIAVGDSISFAGALTGDLSIDASAVREWPDEDTTPPEPDHDKNDDNGNHKGWERPFLNFWQNLKVRFGHQ